MTPFNGSDGVLNLLLEKRLSRRKITCILLLRLQGAIQQEAVVIVGVLISRLPVLLRDNVIHITVY